MTWLFNIKYFQGKRFNFSNKIIVVSDIVIWIVLTGWGTVLVIPAWGLSVAKASLAAITSLFSLAITLHAASCWYRAWLSSWRAVCNCWRCVKLCNIAASHSSCSDFSVAGIEVALGGFGFTIGGAEEK